MGTFPLGKTGGLIEANCSRLLVIPIMEFPLGKTGGLIEAMKRSRLSGCSSWAVSAG